MGECRDAAQCQHDTRSAAPLRRRRRRRAAAAPAFHSADLAFCAAVPAIRRSGAARWPGLP